MHEALQPETGGRTAAALTIVALLLIGPAAQGIGPLADGDGFEQVTSPTPVPGSGFGSASVLEGDLLAVGAPGLDPGRVDVFERGTDGWVHLAIIVPDDPSGVQGFGTDLALDGDHLLVGTDGHGAFLYELGPDREHQLAQLTTDGVGPDDGLGTSVAVDGDHALVGAPRENAQNQESGAVYVFEANGGEWVEDQRLVSPPGACCYWEAHFGAGVALDGDRAVVGAPKASSTYSYLRGGVHLFEATDGTWNHERSFFDPDWWSLTGFGQAVDLDGSTFVVGAPADGWHVYPDRYVSIHPSCEEIQIGTDDRDGSEMGAAYVYRLGPDGSADRTRLVGPDRQAEQRFGSSVAVRQDTVVVGAPYRDASDAYAAVKVKPASSQDSDGPRATTGNDVGSASVYALENDGWRRQATVTPPDATPMDNFGASVSVDAHRVAAGAPGGQERTYVFDADVGDSSSAFAQGDALPEVPDEPSPPGTPDDGLVHPACQSSPTYGVYVIVPN